MLWTVKIRRGKYADFLTSADKEAVSTDAILNEENAAASSINVTDHNL